MADYDIYNKDLIERYLLNRLDEEEMAEFQARMLYDARLRKEVRVMRALQKSLVAARRSSQKTNFLRWRLTLLLVGAAVVLTGLLVYRYNASGTGKAENQSAPPSPELPVQQPVQNSIPPPNDAPEKPAPKPAPIAADFSPNPALEGYLDDNVRGANEHLDITVTPAGKRFIRKEGKIFFQLSGACNVIDKKPALPMKVLIYSSKKEDYENAQPRWEQKIPLSQEGDRVSFQVAAHIVLQPGLYYVLIENEASGAVLYAGKFAAE